MNASAGEECDTRGETAKCTKLCRISRCGDGYINAKAGEVCDDRNASACGSCNAWCTAERSAAKATGRIEIGAPGDLDSGERFILNDGINSPIIFEFVPANWTRSDEEDRKFIRITGTASDLAIAIKEKINAQVYLTINAKVDEEEDDLVRLEHDFSTSLGNKAIREFIGHGTFLFAGMAGGRAGDCPLDSGCTVGADCAPGLACVEGVCQGPSSPASTQ
ncbi:hypothetical protein [Hyalangium gracile]|uniref:hypothetical protein n=1 Tax=Hyalangium gracile TaxID=394092 RepID=UPI001CCE87E9|nr:hypothetical protein [Hyalangium gracile]